MKKVLIIRLLPLIFVGGAIFLMARWLTKVPTPPLTERIPGSDKPSEQQPLENQVPLRLQGKLETFDGIPADLLGSWPRFRGASFDGIGHENVPLAKQWAARGPEILWAIELGEGHAGAAIHQGWVYLLDYDREAQADALRCLSLLDGKEIWRYSYPVRVKRNHGMSRTVCAVSERYVVSLGPKCHVTCLDCRTGQLYWALDLVKEFKTEVPPWYAGQCPLIDEGRAILAPGGDALMIAVDCKSGEVLWRTPNPRGWKMTHSSIIPMQFARKSMFVYCASGGVVGVSVEDGTLLWETPEWKIRIANIPSPVPVGQGRIFLSGGYNAGSIMLQLTEQNDSIATKTLFRLEPEVFGSPQHTPIFFEDHIYGVRPDGQLVCLDLEGNVIWASGSASTFGLGPYLIADGLIYVLNDNGLLTLAKASPAGYAQLAQAQVLTGHDSWGPMALASGRLIVRDLTRMVCLNVAAQP